jgi:hypothetical protein
MLTVLECHPGLPLPRQRRDGRLGGSGSRRSPALGGGPVGGSRRWGRDPTVEPTPAMTRMVRAGAAPIQRSSLPDTRVSVSRQPLGRWGSRSQQAELEQVNRWETDGG